MTDLTTRIESITERQDATNGKIDAVIAAINNIAAGGTIELPDIDISLEDLQTLLTAQHNALRGTAPNNTIAALWSKINVLELTLDSNWPATNTILNNILTELITLNERVNKLQAAVGAEPYNDLNLASARGLLSGILNALNTQMRGAPPVSTPDDRQSGGSVVVDNRRYAVFVPPIANVSIAPNGRDLTPDGTWLGWYAYIQTTDPQPRINSASDIANSWLGLSGTGSINFSVEPQYAISVHLRPPTTAGYEWQYDIGEIPATSTGFGTRWLPVANKYPELTWTTIGGNPRVLSTAGNFSGWRWEIVGGNAPQSVYGTNALTVVANSATGVIPAGSYNTWVVQFYQQPSSGAYIRITPP